MQSFRFGFLSIGLSFNRAIVVGSGGLGEVNVCLVLVMIMMGPPLPHFSWFKYSYSCFTGSVL